MTLDAILAAADYARSDVDSPVAQHRQMSAAMEMVLADYFDVEDLATTIETLAVQLARIGSAIEPYREDHRDDRGDLARAISALFTP
jgi:hypothetical protein